MTFWPRSHFGSPARDAAPYEAPAGRLWLAAAILAIMMVWGGDTLFRANGLYGERAFVTATVLEKRIVNGRRNSRTYKLFIDYGQRRPYASVKASDYDAVQIGHRYRWVVIPGRLGGYHVFVDRPGLKLDPATTMVAFGMIVGAHLIALLALFVWLVRRAERG